MSSRSKLLSAAFEYLRTANPEFNEIIHQARQQVSTTEKISVLQFRLEVDVCDVFDVDGTVPESTDLRQIHVTLSVVNIPPLPGHIITPVTSLSRACMSGQLCVVKCKVTEISSIMQYTQVACYYCPVDGCEGSTEFRYIRIHIPGAAEINVAGSTFYCSVCEGKLEENKSYRRLSSKKTLTVMICDEDLTSCITQPAIKLKVICRDELACRSYRFGEVLLFSGKLVYDSTSSTNSFLHIALEVCSVAEIPSQSVSVVSLNSLPSSISDIYEECVSPAGTYIKLKLALLLSLCTPDSSSKKLNVLCIGRESLLLTRLLDYFSSSIPGSISHSVSNPLYAETRSLSPSTSDYLVSGGSCFLAHKSVCVISDVTSLSQTEERQLMRALEYGDIVLPAPGKLEPVRVNSYCTVWASAEKHQAVVKTSKQSNNNLSVNPALLQLFDLVIFTDENRLATDEGFSIQTLLSTTKPSYKERISHKDFKQLISYARRLEVRFPDDVKSLLAQYYLASRKVRQTDKFTVPMSALKTLLSLAESHCRLSLRTEVLIEDALAAVLLYEEYLSSLTGHSPLSIYTEPHWREEHTYYYLTQQNDEGMELFQRNLENFCKTYVNTDYIEE